MSTISDAPAIKVVGTNGQVSLGKQYAGRPVLVEEREPGVWLIRTATIIPDNEHWAHEPKASADLQSALAWAAANGPSDENTDKALSRLAHDKA